MTISKKEVVKVERVKEATLPPGNYEGEWCGYIVTIKMDNGEFRLTTKNGVRGWSHVKISANDTGDIDIITNE